MGLSGLFSYTTSPHYSGVEVRDSSSKKKVGVAHSWRKSGAQRVCPPLFFIDQGFVSIFACKMQSFIHFCCQSCCSYGLFFLPHCCFQEIVLTSTCDLCLWRLEEQRSGLWIEDLFLNQDSPHWSLTWGCVSTPGVAGSGGTAHPSW